MNMHNEPATPRPGARPVVDLVWRSPGRTEPDELDRILTNLEPAQLRPDVDEDGWE